MAKALGAYTEGGYEAAATCAAELRSVAAILDVRAASAEPARAGPVKGVRRERGSRGWIILAVAAALAVLAASWWLR